MKLLESLKDDQSNSHIKFDILLSFKNLEIQYGRELMESWGETGFFTYLLLKPGYDLNLLKKRNCGKSLKKRLANYSGITI